MRAAAALLAAGLLLSWRASAQGMPEPPPGLVGLLTPPLVADGPPGCHRSDTRTTLAVFAAPGGHGRRLGELRFLPWAEPATECNAVQPHFIDDAGARRPAPSFESGYEETALAVLARDGDWYRIALDEGDGWLRAPPGYRFDSLARLVSDGLAYLTGGWDGRLCERTDATRCHAFPGSERDVRVLETREVGGMDWWRIEIVTPPCEGDGTAVAAGWVPSHGRGRRPALWFHPRGC